VLAHLERRARQPPMLGHRGENECDVDDPTGDSDVSGSPRGTPWDDEQAHELVRRYPALAARFR
jgi:hypothetical protein